MQDHFERYVRFNIDSYRGYYDCGIALDYHRLHYELAQVVGADNILILPFELLENEPSVFLERWLKFLDIYFSNKEIIENLNLGKHNVNKISSDK
ncbi:MAG: hypothetical protein BRC41_13955 [Cyanobacteria bacterium QH_9_48_43]|nr:MAG: hypothetical protein BRC41_13955 [Cyanobacteria bacterium QH_9_48_43]